MTFAHQIISVKPIIKFIWFISSLAVFFTDNIFIISLITFVSLVLYVVTKSYKTIYNYALYGFIPLVIVILILGLSGTPGQEEIIFTFVSIMKWFALGFTAIVFFVIMRPFEIIEVLSMFHIPRGIITALNAGFRFVPIIFEEWQKTYIAQRARGLPPFSILKLHKLPFIISALSIPLLINISQRTEDMYFALKMKGFTFDRRLTTKAKSFSIFDIITLMYSSAIILFSFIL